MICQHVGRALRTRTLYFLVGISAAFIGGIAPLPASADTDPPQTEHAPGDGIRTHDGNGTHNRNIFSVKSPTNNHGYQHTSTSTAGGMTSIQNALCRHAKVCNITLQVILVTPKQAKKLTREKAATPAPEETETLTPDDTSEDDDECACRCAPRSANRTSYPVKDQANMPLRTKRTSASGSKVHKLSAAAAPRT
jgi:hypothetical protein